MGKVFIFPMGSAQFSQIHLASLLTVWGHVYFPRTNFGITAHSTNLQL